MGILDMFDDPNLLGSLLGTGYGAGAGAKPWPPAPPPAPPPQAMAQAQPSFSPTSTLDANTIGGTPGAPGAPAVDLTQRIDPKYAPGIGATPDWAQTAIAGMPFQPKMSEYDPALKPTGSPVAPGGIAVGDRPPPPSALPPVNAGGAPAGPPEQPPMMAPPPGPPMPPMPPRPMDSGPPTMNSGGGLASAFGLSGPGRSALAGIGRSMENIAKLPSGAPRGKAIAAGLGGSITGSITDQDAQRAMARADKNDLFTQNLQTKQYDIAKLNAAIRTRAQEMQIPFWEARTQVLQAQAKQGASTKAWQMSEPGRYHLVDTEVQKHQTGLIAQYRDEIKQATLEGDQEKLNKIRGVIKKETDEFRAEKYKLYNLDPAKKEQTIKRGFEGTEEQIKYLPPGTRFWDPKASVTRTRGADRDNTPITSEQAGAAAPRTGESMPSVPEET